MVREGLGIAAQLAVVGVSVVFTALLLMIGLLALMQRIDRRMTQPETATTMPMRAPAAQPMYRAGGNMNNSVEGDGLTPEVMAAISAAAAIATTRKIRVKRVRYLRNRPEPAWSRQGRVTIMASRGNKR